VTRNVSILGKQSRNPFTINSGVADYSGILQWVLTGAAQFEGAEILVPVAIGRSRCGPDPFLQSPKVGKRDLPSLNSFQQMVPHPA